MWNSPGYTGLVENIDIYGKKLQNYGIQYVLNQIVVILVINSMCNIFIGSKSVCLTNILQTHRLSFHLSVEQFFNFAKNQSQPQS